MQFINKTNEPPINWNDWFKKVNNTRTYNYADNTELHNLHLAKQHLLDEQNGLCAYCQKQINSENSSIEHIIPQSYNTPLSTNYYNLVVVCKKPVKDNNNKLHCDKERLNLLLVNIILYNNAIVTRIKNHPYFSASVNGEIIPKYTLPQNILNQVEAFINILNIGTHTVLQRNRRELLNNIIQPTYAMPNPEKRRYLQAQFERIHNDQSIEYRQYLLIYIANKLGID